MKLAESKTHEFGGYALDTGRIGDTSVDEREIMLPYTGESYKKATLFLRVTPTWRNVVLTTGDGKRYPVDAEREEVDRILWAVFFRKRGTKFYTRFDNGLSQYWNGNLQAQYLLWRELLADPLGVCGILKQLPKEQRRQFCKRLVFLAVFHGRDSGGTGRRGSAADGGHGALDGFFPAQRDFVNWNRPGSVDGRGGRC